MGAGAFVAFGLAALISGAPFLHNLLGPGKTGTLFSGGSIAIVNWAVALEVAAANLVYGPRGILEAGAELKHDPDRLSSAIRFVRTAVVDPDSPELAGLRASQVAWLRDCNQDLQEIASARRVGRTRMLSAVPLDPVLQWREQLISDNDVLTRHIANQATVDAFNTIAKRLFDDSAWEGL